MKRGQIGAREGLQEGRFGKIAWAGVFTPWYRTDQYYEEGGWRGTWKMDGGGAVMNQGVHQVDLMQWIVGPVKTVSAYASSRIHPKIEVEDTMTCAMQFARRSAAFSKSLSTHRYQSAKSAIQKDSIAGRAVAN